MNARTDAERLAAELGAPVGDVSRVTPMLCAHDESAARILAQAGWTYELKLDGVRIVADKRGDRVSLTYRKMRDATESYPDVVSSVRALGEERVVLDGEIVAFDDGGRPDFMRLAHRIQSRARDARRAAQKVRAVYVVFDVLAVGERDLRGLPIEMRRRVLERLLPTADAALRLNPSFDTGAELFRACKEHGLEGVVAKRAGSVYRSGERTTDWVKVKHELEADVVVVGWTEGEGKRSRFGSIDVASFEDGRLVARGAVGSGLDEKTIEMLLGRLRALEVDEPVAEGRYAMRSRRHHVRPELVVNVRYMQLTSDGMLRHSVFRGIRDDVRPDECTLAPRAAEDVIYKYYERAVPAMLPWLARRPCMLVKADGPLWPLPKWTPKRIKTTVVRTGGREARGVIVDEVDVLRFAVEAGATGVLAQPFREGEEGQDFVAFRATAPGAGAVRRIAEEIGLSPWAKAGNGGAIDVIVPLAPAPPDAAKALATLIARLAGEGVEVLEAVAAPWSVIEGRRAAAPLDWDDLGREAPSIDHADPSPLPPTKPGDLARAVQRLERLVTSLAGPKPIR